MSDVISLVRRLAERFELGLLTNGETDYQISKFRSLELEPFFLPDRILATESIGVHKPDPGAFQPMIDALGMDADRILFVGDNPVNDIAGAAGMGMKTCWIQLQEHHQCPVEPTWRIDSLLDLEQLPELGLAREEGNAP